MVNGGDTSYHSRYYHKHKHLYQPNRQNTGDVTGGYIKSWESEIKEPVICKHFGCGRQLSLQEEMCGQFCVHHLPSFNARRFSR